ncbi:nuclear envelope integral membrane protein 1 isoform X1 [Prunus yedoensis var. nudiflora]|uniref:Nuclear envelope integral membrane protein 1 isoform X1 n=1 Tax=Prunus yedoensis var. nudiflora TaxID=2094558 RepID=A0A314YW24_PRUYE|nr:nuclear envelope integral membrane protein 1 isoform X1 [Prunus yedoensis var. nudiflora]
MASAEPGRIFACILWLLFFSLPFSSSVEPSSELSLVAAESARLQLSHGMPVKNAPGSKPGTLVLCERVHIRGLSRLKYLGKFANTAKLKISATNSSIRIPAIEVCLHRNTSLGIGMCPHSQWEKVAKGSWSGSMSPFELKLLDIRTAGSSLGSFEVSIEEEFFRYRLIFLILGIIIMSLASLLSKSLVFYYSSGMAIGVVLVILIVLFQGMKLLPTGRKNSLAFFVYSSLVGLGSFLLRYIPGLLRSILTEIGVSEDMYNPLAIFLLAFVFLAGAWLGFWVVRKLVLTEDGSIDIMTSQFVYWSIQILGALMTFQSSADHLLAAEATVFGFLVSVILKKIFRWRFLRRVYRYLSFPFWSLVMAFHYYDLPSFPSSKSTMKLLKSPRKNSRRLEIPDSPPSPPSPLSDSGLFASTFHTTPERRKFSKEEWEMFTAETTNRALQELASSPDFHRWCSSNVERISVVPRSTRKVADQPRRWWLL